MAGVDPQAQARKDCVLLIHYAVTIAAIFWFVIFGQGQKTIGMVILGLRCEVPEQLFAAGDASTAISVQDQKSIVGARSSPRNFDRMTVTANIEHHTILSGGQMKTFAFRVNEDRAGITAGLQGHESASVPQVLLAVAATAARVKSRVKD